MREAIIGNSPVLVFSICEHTELESNSSLVLQEMQQSVLQKLDFKHFKIILDKAY